MSLELWKRNGWLREYKTSVRETASLLTLVGRDLNDAAREEISTDWQFNIAFNAGLQLATVVLYAAGYRAGRGESKHYRVIQALPLVTGNTEKRNSVLKVCAVFLISGLFIAVTFGTCPAESQNQKTFPSPAEAVKALVDALKADDTKTLSAIFGPGSEDVVSSGDPVADNAERERFVDFYEQKNRLEKADTNKAVLYIGKEDWPFPIPIVKKGGAWQFDTDEGREEILARRIGRNELNVIQTCLAYVDAQREYALKDRDSDALLAYAQKFASDPGKKDGLYW